MYSLPDPNKKIMVLSGHIDLRVEKGMLRIKHGFPNDEGIRVELLSRGTCDVDHVVIIGRSGSMTLDGITWLMDMGIVVTMLDYHGDVVTDMLPPEHLSPLVKQKQAGMSDALKTQLAKDLLAEKLSAQRGTLATIGTNPDRIKMFRRHEKQLKGCRTITDMRAIESHSANLYWGSFSGLPMNWKPLPVQPHWLTIGNRVSPKSGGNARRSISPFHSCLNYLYTVLESRVKRYCIAYRLDVDYPVLHSNSRQNRSGLVYDLMEPLRPMVDRMLYQWITNQTLKPKDFLETREGVCKVDPALASKLIVIIKELDPVINQTVKSFQAHFKSKMRDVSSL